MPSHGEVEKGMSQLLLLIGTNILALDHGDELGLPRQDSSPTIICLPELHCTSTSVDWTPGKCGRSSALVY